MNFSSYLSRNKYFAQNTVLKICAFQTSRIGASKTARVWESISPVAVTKPFSTQNLLPQKFYNVESPELGPVGTMSREAIQDAEESLVSFVTQRDHQGFEKALSILIRLVEEQQFLLLKSNRDEKGDAISYHVNPFLLNQVVDCWRICWKDNIIDTKPTKVLEIIEHLENMGMVPDSRTLTLIMDGIILRGDRHEAPLLAQWLLDRRMDQADKDSELRPDTVMFTNVIRAWSKSRRLEAPEMAEGILQLMYDLYENGGWTDSGPNTLSYGATMEAWANSRSPEASAKMHKLLEDMKHSRVNAVRPDRVSYVYVINSWANSHSVTGPDRANELLQEMLQLYNNGNDDVAPDSSIFSRVILAYARRGNVEKPEDLMEQLQDMYSSTGDPRFRPSDDCWKAMIIGLAKSGSPAEAQGLLDELIERALMEEDHRIMPKRSYFVDILVAWSKDKNRLRAAEQSQKVLMRLLDLARAGYPQLLPDAKSFETVARAWSKTTNRQAARNIESLILLMDKAFKDTQTEIVKPRGKIMDLALVAWSRSNQDEAPDRAEALVKEMEVRFADGDKSMMPTRGSFTSLMLTWQRSSRDNASMRVQQILDMLQKKYNEGANQLRPDLYMYSVAMDSFAQQGNVAETQALFDRMQKDYSTGNHEAKPDIQAYNIVLKAIAFSKDPKKAQKAESLFEKNCSLGLELVPNRQTFIQMISVWSFSNHPNAADKCEYYFSEMKRHRFEATVGCYTNVIDSLTKSKDPNAVHRAEQVLGMLLNDAKEGKIKTPFHKPYKKFLQTIARSKIPRRNVQAQQLLSSLVPNSRIPRTLLPNL
eukprot:scaffold1169_cov120-Cylindrotheca_fusiformis.AAC.20